MSEFATCDGCNKTGQRMRSLSAPGGWFWAVTNDAENDDEGCLITLACSEACKDKAIQWRSADEKIDTTPLPYNATALLLPLPETRTPEQIEREDYPASTAIVSVLPEWAVVIHDNGKDAGRMVGTTLDGREYIGLHNAAGEVIALIAPRAVRVIRPCTQEQAEALNVAMKAHETERCASQ